MWIRRLFELYVVGAVLVAATRPARGLPPPAAPKTASEQALSADRERFKLGMERYEAGAFAQAIDCWEPIYRELGAERGYRLAYDLGVAYAEIGDDAAAAERLRAFLAGIDLRRARGENLAAIVEKEEADARARLAVLSAEEPRRIPDDRGEAPAPASDEWRPDAGQMGEGGAPRDPASPERPVPLPRSETAGNVGSVPTAIALQPHHPAPSIGRDTVHPFSPALVVAGGGLSLAAALLVIPLEKHAWTLRDRYAVEAPAIPASDRQAFEAARTAAYVTMGAAAALGVLTGTLAAWYFLGSTERGAFVRPAASPLLGGATVDVAGQF